MVIYLNSDKCVFLWELYWLQNGCIEELVPKYWKVDNIQKILLHEMKRGDFL